MRVAVCLTNASTPTPGNLNAAGADLVVLCHMDGLWSVWRDREHGSSASRVPWDLLPSHVKRAIPLYPANPT